MKWLGGSKVKSVLIESLAALLVGSGGSAHAEFIFGTPTNLGPLVNSSAFDGSPHISADGLMLYFDSLRPGLGNWDIWVTTAQTTNYGWGAPVPLPPPVNSSYGDSGPCISADGLSLYFASDRPGGYGSYDLWVTTRKTTEDPWEPPVNLGPIVNSPFYDNHPYISADGLSLYFDSYAPFEGYGSADIYVTTRETKNSPWGKPINLGPTVNTHYREYSPYISSDGLTLLFERRTETRHIRLTTRRTTDDDWATSVNLGPPVNTSNTYTDAADPSISVDGSMLYFVSDRPDGVGDADLWQVSISPVVDLNGDGIVNLMDFSKLAQYWLQEEPSVDIAPPPLGDGKVDFKDLAVLAEHWLEGYTEIVYIQWLGHSSVKVWAEDVVIYIDPRNLSESLHDATLVLVTHSHGDHYQPADIARVSGPKTLFTAPPDVVALYGKGQAIAPGQTIQFDGFSVTAVPAYNTNKPNHPKSNNWVGYIIEIASKRIYAAGDTDLIEEMKTLGDIDVAILPAGGTYTMNAQEAAEATKYIKPLLAIPYHWGQNVGTLSDAERFAEMAACNVKIMSVGEILSSKDWLKDFSLIAHWKLDEAEGTTAHDSAGDNDGTIHGEPLWQPTAGKIDGALQLDGIDDCVSTPFVLNPADGAFSVFAWIKGGSPEQVVLSQTDGTNWLCTHPSDGKLMTNLIPPAGRFAPPPLISESVITDGVWHRIGFVWDGSQRMLYVDDVEVAKDTQTQLAGSTAGLYIGAGKSFEPGSFWSGLIDDVRIHDRSVSP